MRIYKPWEDLTQDEKVRRFYWIYPLSISPIIIGLFLYWGLVADYPTWKLISGIFIVVAFGVFLWLYIPRLASRR